MSSSRKGRASRSFTKDEANDLIFKLQPLLPSSSSSSSSSTSSSNKKTSASKILKRTCNYIKKLQKEVDDLSDGLSQRLASGDIPATTDADIITTLLKLSNKP